MAGSARESISGLTRDSFPGRFRVRILNVVRDYHVVENGAPAVLARRRGGTRHHADVGTREGGQRVPPPDNPAESKRCSPVHESPPVPRSDQSAANRAPQRPRAFPGARCSSASRGSALEVRNRRLRRACVCPRSAGITNPAGAAVAPLRSARDSERARHCAEPQEGRRGGDPETSGSGSTAEWMSRASL